MDTCERIIAMQGLSVPLSAKIREYFTKLNDLEKWRGTRAMVGRMSPMLQSEVVSAVYADWIEDVPWIQKMSYPCLVRLIMNMTNFLYVPRERIFDRRATCFLQR